MLYFRNYILFEEYFLRNPGLMDFGLKEGYDENVYLEMETKNVAE